MRVAPAQAVVQALELARTPILAAAMRRMPLPSGILDVIRLASGCRETSSAAETMYGAEPAFSRDAAVLYIQEVLFHANSDYYRVLGVQPDADQTELREHFFSLMKWLHPDVSGASWEAPFVTRVTVAWNALKTPHRRADYDFHAAMARDGDFFGAAARQQGDRAWQIQFQKVPARVRPSVGRRTMRKRWD